MSIENKIAELLAESKNTSLATNEEAITPEKLSLIHI